MKQEDIDKIHEESHGLVVFADKIIEKLDVLRIEKDNYNHLFMVEEKKTAGPNKDIVVSPVATPSSTQEDFSIYLGKLESLCNEINGFIIDLHTTDEKLSDVFKFINLRIFENQELARMSLRLKSRLNTIYLMLEEIINWLFSLTRIKTLRISDDPIETELNIKKMVGLSNTIIQFTDAIGLDMGLIKNFQLFHERLKREGVM